MVTNVTISAADSGNPKQGCPDNWGVTFLNGATVCYLSLSKAGAEETTYPRWKIDASTGFQWGILIPQSFANNYTVMAYDQLTGGNVIGTTTAFTVIQSTLATLPLAGDAVIQTLGDSTSAQYYTEVAKPAYDGNTTEMRWLAIATRLLGYPADFSIWPNYHNGAVNSNERYAGGGAYYGVTGNTSSLVGTNPAYITQIYSSLMQRPKLLIIQVTVNDILLAIPTATAIANYTTIANMATLSGCNVLFAMMRPGSSGTLNSGNQATRVTINNAIANICSTISGCYYWDPSPVYTLASPNSGPSAYNNANPIDQQNLIITLHPTAQGGALEAQSLVSRFSALGVFSSSNNYPLTIYNNTAAYTSYTVAPNFNTGNNAGVTLTNGASGTFLNGITSCSGGGTTNSTVVGSTASNPDTSGMMQVLTITPGGTTVQLITTTLAGPTRTTPFTGYAGLMECMVEVDIVTDTESLIQAVTLSLEGKFGSPSMTLYYDGPGGMSTAAGDTPPTPTGTQKYWFWCRTLVPPQNTIMNYYVAMSVNPNGKSANAVAYIRRHYIRQYPVDARSTRILPQAPTLSTNGASSGGSVPLTITYSGSGTMPQGFRTFYKISNNQNGYTYGGDIYTLPGTTSYGFNVTGLTSGSAYDFRINAIRYANVLGGGNGPYYLEGTPSNVITATANGAPAGDGQGTIGC